MCIEIDTNGTLRLERAGKMKSKPWYWICYGQYKNSIAFNCTEATRSTFTAYATIAYRNRKESVGKWFVREDFEHPDRDMKQFSCPECKNLISQKELDKTWDWAGPHCNNCGCTGMRMFGEVMKDKPVISGRHGGNPEKRLPRWVSELPVHESTEDERNQSTLINSSYEEP